MNKKISSFTVVSLSLIFLILMITSSDTVIESVSFSISIWKDNLFPTLFPFFVVSNILMQYGFVDIIGNILSIPMKKIYKLPGEAGFVLAASLFSGFPSGAKYTTNLVKENKITESDASRLLTFTHYSNPLFILGFIGNIVLNNQKIAFLILISHILAGLIVGYLFSINIKNDIKIEKKIQNNTKKEITFGKCLSDSVMDSLNTMFLLLGIVTVFLICSTMIENLFNLPKEYASILSGILEMTQGIKSLTTLEISDFLKTIIITGIISFGGFSVHMQVISIISEYKIKYKQFLIARILHMLIACIFVSILYLIFTY